MSRTEQHLVAAIALCDLRTLARYSRGENVRPVVRERIEHALRQLSLERFINPQPEQRATA
jgi:hypothetical protein